MFGVIDTSSGELMNLDGLLEVKLSRHTQESQYVWTPGETKATKVLKYSET